MGDYSGSSGGSKNRLVLTTEPKAFVDGLDMGRWSGRGEKGRTKGELSEL